MILCRIMINTSQVLTAGGFNMKSTFERQSTNHKQPVNNRELQFSMEIPCQEEVAKRVAPNFIGRQLHPASFSQQRNFA